MLQTRYYRMSGAIPALHPKPFDATPAHRYCLRNLLHGSPLEYFRFGHKGGSAMCVTTSLLLALCWEFGVQSYVVNPFRFSLLASQVPATIASKHDRTSNKAAYLVKEGNMFWKRDARPFYKANAILICLVCGR